MLVNGFNNLWMVVNFCLWLVFFEVCLVIISLFRCLIGWFNELVKINFIMWGYLISVIVIWLLFWFFIVLMVLFNKMLFICDNVIELIVIVVIGLLVFKCIWILVWCVMENLFWIMVFNGLFLICFKLLKCLKLWFRFCLDLVIIWWKYCCNLGLLVIWIYLFKDSKMFW